MKRNAIIAAAVFLLCSSAALLAALGTATSVSISNPNGVHPMQPVSVMGNWQNVNTAPGTADNAGSEVLVATGLSRAAIIPLNILGNGTSLQVRMQYATSGSTTTAPVIQIFGLDANGIPERLYTSTPAHDLTMTVDTANDVQDATHAYTASQEVDANGSSQIMVAVKTAASGTAFASAVIQVRVK